jgi:ADP-ribose pyrophosphatase YjhB (NUDIX family)
MSLLNCFVSVCLVLMQQDDVLFLLRQNTEYGDGLYGMPGGGMLENERLTQAVVRIAKVQLGINNDRSHSKCYTSARRDRFLFYSKAL